MTKTIIPITDDMVRKAAEHSVGGKYWFYEFPYNHIDRERIKNEMREILEIALSIDDVH